MEVMEYRSALRALFDHCIQIRSTGLRPCDLQALLAGMARNFYLLLWRFQDLAGHQKESVVPAKLECHGIGCKVARVCRQGEHEWPRRILVIPQILDVHSNVDHTFSHTSLCQFNPYS